MTARTLVTVVEAGEIMGVGRSKAYELVKEDRMPGLVRLGKSVRVHRQVLLDWLEAEARASAPLRVVR